MVSTTNLEKALSNCVGADYHPKIGRKVTETVHNALVNSLRVNGGEILPEATILEDLNAESIEGLDISFRIERGLGIKINQYENILLVSETDGEYALQTVLGLTKFVYDKKISKR